MEDIANIQKYCKLSQYQLHIDSRLLNDVYEANSSMYTINFDPILKNVVSIKVLDSYMKHIDVLTLTNNNNKFKVNNNDIIIPPGDYGFSTLHLTLQSLIHQATMFTVSTVQHHTLPLLGFVSDNEITLYFPPTSNLYKLLGFKRAMEHYSIIPSVDISGNMNTGNKHWLIAPDTYKINEHNYMFMRCNDYFETSRKNMITSYSYLEKIVIQDGPQTYYYDDDLEHKLPRNIINLNIRFEDYTGNLITNMPDYHTYTLLIKYYKEPEHDYNKLASQLTYTPNYTYTEEDFGTDEDTDNESD